jgi:hypothetical protein
VGDNRVIEPETADAWVTQCAEHFQNRTGKMLLSPVDYDTFVTWEATGMPLACALSGIDESVRRIKGPRHRTSAKYAHHAVMDAFEQWQRAVGPQYGGQDNGQ